MIRTIEAIITPDGDVKLLENVALDKEHRALVTILEEVPLEQGLRPYGLLAGQFVVPDDFDEPLPDDILAAFEGQ
jgi:hypothetical protein